MSNRQLARQILSSNARISLYPKQVSGVEDKASARHNILQVANGLPARRSSYGGAPGGTVSLSSDMLAGMLSLAGAFRFRVTAIAGGAHSQNSRHYRGLAFDVDMINDIPVSSSHASVRDFMARAARLGATEVLGPGDASHDTHIHVGWRG